MVNQIMLCPACYRPMSKAGFGWSGKKRIQRYRCASAAGCGRVTTKPTSQPPLILIDETRPRANQPNK